MKIIQHGNPEKLKELAATKVFRCASCGCIFEADWSEYTEKKLHKKKSIFSCDCPECKLFAYEKEDDGV